MKNFKWSLCLNLKLWRFKINQVLWAIYGVNYFLSLYKNKANNKNYQNKMKEITCPKAALKLKRVDF